MKYRLRIAPSLEEIVRLIPPVLKRKIRSALEAIQEDPQLGKPLRDELEGLWSYRVDHYRIIYRIHRQCIEIQVIDIGPRGIIYERVVEFLRSSL